MTAFGDAWLADVKADAADQVRPAAGAARSGPRGVGRVGRRRQSVGRPGRRRPGARAERRGRQRRPAPPRTPRPTYRPGWRRWWQPSGSSSSSCCVAGRAPEPAAGPAAVTSAAQRLRAIPSWQVTLGVALLALGFLIAAQLAVRGSARPLHDPGADAAGRDRQRAAGPAGRAQDPDPRPARADPGRREPGRGRRRPRPAAQRAARAGAHRGRPHRADRDRDRPPARGLEGSRSRPTAASRTTSSARATSGSSSRSCGAPAPRRSRSTASGSPRPRRSSTSARRCWSTRPTSRRRTRSRALGPPDLYDRLSASPGFVDFVRARSEGYGIRVSLAEPESVDMPAFVGTVTLRYSRPLPSPSAVAVRDAQQRAGRLTMHRRRSQLTIAAVAFVLGLLVVVQLRSQAGDAGLAQLSSQDLTVLVANLNARNDQLRREASSLERRARDARRRTARAATSRSTRSPPTCERVRAYAGLDPVAGPGRHDLDPRPDRRAGRRGAHQRAAQRRRRGDRRRRRPGRDRRRRDRRARRGRGRRRAARRRLRARRPSARRTS